MRETVIRDDLTHELITEAQLAKAAYVFGELEGTFEGRQASVDALVALFRDHDSTKLAALLPGPEPKAAKPKARTGKHGGGEFAQARAWAKTPEGQETVTRLGLKVAEAGKVSGDLVKAWHESLAA